MSGVRDLYQELILEHSKNPRNFRKQEDARAIEGYNPLCGDHFIVYLKMNGDVIQDLSFQGSGCAISKASASVMTQILKGKKREEAEKLFGEFHDLVTGKVVADEEMGKLAVFGGVSQFPMRVKCATLAWHTVHAALQGEEEVVSTE
jgi:nitrogen fixation protein NifU and related proteins